MFISMFINTFVKSQETVVQNSPEKIKITTDVAPKSVITIEELKTERLNEFENKYEKMQSDFDMYRKVDTPKDVEFQENTVDNKIDADTFSSEINKTITQEQWKNRTLYKKQLIVQNKMH